MAEAGLYVVAVDLERFPEEVARRRCTDACRDTGGPADARANRLVIGLHGCAEEARSRWRTSPMRPGRFGLSAGSFEEVRSF